MMLWLDLETSGLDPHTHQVLEVGALLLNDDFNQVDSFSQIVGDDVNEDVVVPYVLDMHSKNGLWDLVTASETTITEVDEMLLAFLKNQGAEKNKVPLCGSSIHFDRGFMKVHLPKTEDWLSYRNIDISTLKELAKRLNYPKYEGPQTKAHRCLDDIQHSLREFRHYQNTMFK